MCTLFLLFCAVFFFFFLLSCHPFKVILLHTCISSRMHAVTYLNNTSFFSIVSLLCGVASEDYPRCLCARVCVFFFFFFCCCFLGISKWDLKKKVRSTHWVLCTVYHQLIKLNKGVLCKAGLQEPSCDWQSSI